MLLRILKSKIFILFFVTLIILIVIGLSAKPNSKMAFIGDVISVPLSPVQNFFTTVGKKVEGSFSFFKDMKTLRQENVKLKADLDRKENVIRELKRYEQENKDLREALNLKNQFNDYVPVGGNIIAKDIGNWFNIFTIDRGTKDGLRGNSPVITSKGLVGYLIQVDPISSKVMSIIDPGCTVMGQLSKSFEPVRIKGDLKLKELGMCKGDYISTDAEIDIGDTIETSGMGGIFPKGILIGRVKEIRQAGSEMNKYVVIEPAVDFKRLQEVFVLKNKNQNSAVGSAKK